MAHVTCNCGESFDYDLPDHVDLTDEPERIEEIQSGSFLEATCPTCETVLKLEVPVLLSTTPIDILSLSEKDRHSWFTGDLEHDRLDAISRTPRGRVTFGYAELVEKINAVKLDLDDRVIEIMKYHLLAKALESEVDQGEVAIRFDNVNGSELIFLVDGMRPGETAVARLPRTVYEKAAGDVDAGAVDEPLDELISGPYVNVKKLLRTT